MRPYISKHGGGNILDFLIFALLGICINNINIAQDSSDSASFKSGRMVEGGGLNAPTSGADCWTNSASFRSEFSICDPGVDAVQTSASFNAPMGYMYVINLPPKIVGNAQRYPQDEAILGTTMPSFQIVNPNDYDTYDQLHFNFQVSTDAGFNGIVFEAHSVAGQTNWLQSTGGSPWGTLVSAGIPAQDSSFSAKRFLVPSEALAAGNWYYWRIRALDGAGEYSQWSTTFLFAAAPPVPSLISPTDGAALVTGTPTLDWTDEAVADYNIQIAADVGFNGILYNQIVTTSSFAVSPPLTNGVFWWRVRGRDAAGNPFPWSDAWKFTVSGQTPVVSLTVGSQNPFDKSELPGTTDVPMTQFVITAGANNVLVSSINLVTNGTGNDAAGITSVKLYMDLDSNGQISGGDSLLGTGTFAADDGDVTFGGLNISIPSNASRKFLTVYSFDAGTVDGDTFKSHIPAAGIIATVGGNPAVMSGSSIVSGGTVTISSGPGAVGSLTIAKGAQSIESANIVSTTQNVAILQFVASASSIEDVGISSLTILATGSGNDQTDIASVLLVEDANADGAYTNGIDTLIGTQSYNANNGTVTFPGVNITIPANGFKTFLIVYNFSGVGSAGSTFEMLIPSATSITATGGTSGTAITPEGLPITSGTVEISTTGSFIITVGPSNPPVTNRVNNEANVPILQIKLTAGSVEDVNVKSITFTAAGSGNDKDSVSLVRLFKDTNGNGFLDTADVQLSASTVYAADNGAVTFSGFSESIPAHQSRTWLLVYDLNGTAVPNETFKARLIFPADVQAEGASTQLGIVPAGLPIDGNDAVIVPGGSPGTLVVTKGQDSPLNGFVFANQQATSMVQIQVYPTIENMKLTALKIHALGTGNDVTDITGVTLYEDKDGNGIFTTGVDIPITGSSLYDADNGSITFSPASYFLSANKIKQLIILYDFSGSAVPGQKFSLFLTPAIDVEATGVTSAQVIPGSGLQIQGAEKTIGSPGVGGAAGEMSVQEIPFENPEYEFPIYSKGVAVLKARLSMSSFEGAVVEQISIKASGTGSDAGDISSIAIYKDNDGDGLVSSSDSFIFSKSGPFATDNGEAVLNGINFAIQAGASADIIIVVDFSGLGAAGGSYQFSWDVQGTTIARGLSSNLFVTVQANTIEGPKITSSKLVGSSGRKGVNSCLGSTKGGGVWPGAFFLFLAVFALAIRPWRGKA